MAKKVIWTNKAKSDRLAIFDYWTQRNKSKAYSIKLHLLFQEATKIIGQYPDIGKPTSEANVKMKIVSDYLMFYEISSHQIFILTIWDSRQNPQKITLK